MHYSFTFCLFKGMSTFHSEIKQQENSKLLMMKTRGIRSQYGDGVPFVCLGRDPILEHKGEKLQIRHLLQDDEKQNACLRCLFQELDIIEASYQTRTAVFLHVGILSIFVVKRIIRILCMDVLLNIFLKLPIETLHANKISLLCYMLNQV